MSEQKKRKIQHTKTNKLQNILQACELLQDDSDKIKLVVDYIKQLNINVSSDYTWIKKEETLKILSALDITPKNDHPFFSSFNKVSVDVLEDCYENFVDTVSSSQDFVEPFEKARAHISEYFGLKRVRSSHIFSLMSSLEKLDILRKGAKFGESVVSAAISSLLEVVCNILGHFHNGDKQRDIILDDNLPVFHVRSDGTIAKDLFLSPYFLREDKSLDDYEEWENGYTDAYKLILSMKSTLREKLIKEKADKEDRMKYNKILGLNFLKSSAHLFLLEVELVEDNDEIIPYYYLSHQSYGVNTTNLIIIWLLVLKFANEYVPKRLYSAHNYGPTKGTSSNKLTQLVDVTSSLSTTESTKSYGPKTKLHKKVIKYYENEQEQRYTYIVMSSTFLKKVTKDEMSIIVHMVELDSFSPYLPRIMNVYHNIVEFEVLECLPQPTKENMLLDLVIDISKALHFLHTNQIIHRDVKPTNMMIRSFSQHCNDQFVLIDFGLSFIYEKKDNFYLDKQTGKKTTANVGTSYFKAPEVNAETNYDEKIDIYSLGASVVYLMNNQKLQGSDWKLNVEELTWQLLEFKQLVLQMLDLNPNNRPSAMNIAERMKTIRNTLEHAMSD